MTYLKLSDDDIKLFEDVALEFGKRWRKDLKKPVPPKLHLMSLRSSGDIEGSEFSMKILSRCSIIGERN
jgi:hypothetical protein